MSSMLNRSSVPYSNIVDDVRRLRENNRIRALDEAFSLFLLQQAQSLSLQMEDSYLLVMLGAYASQQLSEQHTCVELSHLNQPFHPFYRFPEKDTLQGRLQGLGLLYKPGVTQSNTLQAYLVLDNQRVYLQRYWQYEKAIAGFITDGLSSPVTYDVRQLSELIEKIFPDEEETKDTIDWQKVSVTLACLKRVAFITGGPGTGKTTTVAKLLWVLIQQKAEKQLNIKVVAPTGKAAARMNESLRMAQERLSLTLGEDPSLKVIAGIQCSTIHRLLGSIRNSVFFRHNQNNQLDVDVLIIDEASMVDLPLMAKLFTAIPNGARVIVLGDSNQLASVEVGSVLADICHVAESYGNYSADFAQEILTISGQSLPFNTTESIPGIRDHIVTLIHSHRFNEHSAIGRLAKHVNEGSAELSVETLCQSDGESLRLLTKTSLETLFSALTAHFETYFDLIKVGEYCGAHQLLSKNQVLCGSRSGYWGVENINQFIEQKVKLFLKGADSGPYYPGRPIMITSNDYQRNLFNGDIGVCGLDEKGLAIVYFFEGDETRRFLPGQLPSHETIYAMTIHKSQGSEFEEVHICLPDIRENTERSVISKELLYTAITRARSRCNIYATPKEVEIAVNTRGERSSGLVPRLTRELADL